MNRISLRDITKGIFVSNVVFPIRFSYKVFPIRKDVSDPNIYLRCFFIVIVMKTKHFIVDPEVVLFLNSFDGA